MISWLVVATVVVVASLEVTVRLDDWAQFGVPLAEPAISLEELAVRDSLGYHARPNSSYRQFRINSLGFRGQDVKISSLGRPLILTTGASETFGLYEEAGKEWPQQLADSLALCAPRPSVLNAAFAGMTLPTVRQDFTNRLQAFSPEVVIYYPTPMQYLKGQRPMPAKPAAGDAPILPSFRFRSLPRFRDAFKRATPEPILNLLRRASLVRDRSIDGVSPRNQVDDQPLDWFEADLRGLIGTYRRAGVTPVLVVHANRFSDTTSNKSRQYLTAWERFYPAFTGAAIVRYDSAAALRTLRVGQDSGVIVVDARNELHRHGDAFSDYSHFNEQGSSIVAGAVARAILPVVCQQ